MFSRNASLVAALVLFACSAPIDPKPGYWKRATAKAGADDPPDDEDPTGMPPIGNPGSAGATGAGGAKGATDPAGGQGGNRVGGGSGGSVLTMTRDGGLLGSPDAGLKPLMSDAAAVPAGPTVPCGLKVTVTTVATGREYSPSNIGAVWIADGAGKFIKSLKVWAADQRSHLGTWNSATGGANQATRLVDAVTGATLGSHRMHTVAWNCTDAKKMPAPNGEYRVYFEMNDTNGGSQNAFVPFTKGTTAFDMAIPDVMYFKARRLVFTP